MTTYFDATFFSGNRKKLRALCKEDIPIVIAANGQMQKSADTAFPFCQESNFWYLTGVQEPSVLLVIDTNETYLIMPEMSEYQAYFDGQASGQELTDVSGIDTVLSHKNGWAKLLDRVAKTGAVYSLTPPPVFIDTYGIYTNPTRKALVDRLLDADQNNDVIDIRQELASLRMTKQPAELRAIQKAIDVTIHGLEEIRQGVWQSEQEIVRALTISFLQQGHYSHGYGPIVSAGKNACLLHYEAASSAIKKDDLVLLDVGAEVAGYMADITRVYATGAVTKRQREVYEAVVAVHDYALSLQKPGVSIRDNEKLVESFMGEQLIKLGLIKEHNRERIRHYYPHSTSHYLGVDTHDLGDYDQPLAENMVLTVEPGIYIPEEGIGIRIEDDVLITKDGHQVLSSQLPRDL